MQTRIVQFRRDAAHHMAPADAVLGPQQDGSIVCAIDDCPDAVPPERLRELFPTPDVLRVAFADLPVRDGGCCGGSCGG
ncbi:hypothetical protein [Niveispirillum sp. KHB5.9]|uniref:hypothetical protein n=1 Tax=Niveispirillum sp. KHB5.9 TaxID=3400269 RepID=UPI003A859C2D